MQVTVDIASTDGKLQLRADAVQVLDAGFLRAFDNFDPGKKGRHHLQHNKLSLFSSS